MKNDTQEKWGDRIESEDCGRDLVTEMLCVRKRPDVLAAQLRHMGVTDSGDEPEDETE